ncbi:lysylphosphatidylglycerol synthase domain-containing protein, partial [candidate division KSB1 bacterium]
MVLLPANLVLQSLRWKTLLDSTGKYIGFKDLIRSVLTGIAIGSITPGKVGEIGKAFFIKGIDKKELLFYAVFEKLYSFFVIVLMGSISVLFLKDNIPELDLIKDNVLIFFTSVLIFCTVLILINPVLFIRKLPFISRFGKFKILSGSDLNGTSLNTGR